MENILEERGTEVEKNDYENFESLKVLITKTFSDLENVVFIIFLNKYFQKYEREFEACKTFLLFFIKSF